MDRVHRFVIRRWLFAIAMCTLVPIVFGAGFVIWARSPRPISLRFESLGAVGARGRVEPQNWSVLPAAINSLFGPFERFADVFAVQIESDQLSDRDLTVLLSLGTVGQLEVKSASITDEGLKALCDCPNITHLTFECRKISDTGLSVIGCLNALDAISVVSDHVTGEFLAHLSKDASLKELVLEGRMIDDTACRYASAQPSLEAIVLSSTRITDEGLQDLANLPRLKTLAVIRSTVTAKGVARFRGIAPKVKVYSSFDE